MKQGQVVFKADRSDEAGYCFLGGQALFAASPENSGGGKIGGEAVRFMQLYTQNTPKLCG